MSGEPRSSDIGARFVVFEPEEMVHRTKTGLATPRSASRSTVGSYADTQRRCAGL